MNIKIIKSNRKTISIEIKENELIVRAPSGLDNTKIHSYIESKRNWIEKHIKYFEENNDNNQSSFTKLEIEQLKIKAKEYIPKRVDYFAHKMGVNYKNITIRSQKTKWASCSSKGNLNFNCLLMLFPGKIIDSVIVHELCHRKYMNHSKDFYAEYSKNFSEYKQCEKWLKENGRQYITRLRTK